MRLLVDMGNQRMKWALVQTKSSNTVAELEARLLTASRAAEVDQRPGKSYTEDAPVAPDRQSPWSGEAPTEIWLSSVSTGVATSRFTERCLATWHICPRVAHTPGAFRGLVNRYDRPGQLGVDRWLAAVGAHAMYCGNDAFPGVVIVDAGTAVTVDVVFGNDYLGGAILPGIRMITEALGSNTGQIRLDIDSLANADGASHDSGVKHKPSDAGSPAAQNLTGTNSNDAVAAGALASICGGVRYCIESARRRFGPLPVVVSGGDEAVIVDSLGMNPEPDGSEWMIRQMPTLVLLGLALTAERED